MMIYGWLALGVSLIASCYAEDKPLKREGALRGSALLNATQGQPSSLEAESPSSLPRTVIMESQLSQGSTTQKTQEES